MTAVATPVMVKPPKHILVNGKRIHLRVPQNIAWAVATVSMATASVAAAYKLLLEQRYGPVYLKPGWDGLFGAYTWWTVYRHGLRNVGEGVLANLGIRSLIVSWKKHYNERLEGWRLGVRAVLVLLSSFVLIIAGVWVINYAGPWAWHAVHLHHLTGPVHNNSVANNVTSGFSWENFALGFVITHIIRVMWSPVGNTISAAFIERQVARAKGRTPLWVRLPLAPPTMRERFAWTQQTHPHVEPRKDWATRVVMALVILAIPLAGYGEYVLHVIAKGG